MTFILNPAGLAELLNSPAGPVALDLARRAIRVETQAKINASHSRPSVPGSGPAVRTGRLRSSIAHRIGVDERGLYAEIGSNVPYAFPVEVTYNRPFLVPALSAAA